MTITEFASFQSLALALENWAFMTSVQSVQFPKIIVLIRRSILALVVVILASVPWGDLGGADLILTY